ncbi:asparagine synthase-domain-containing protein [Phycomyces blakesleeanus]|uniref:Asparagine synthase-domain-containing protein n=1 Tax=Phycomyces blakesleeanus TaxID=4837 RepID=A0ABR3B4R2_PHYBL
MCGILFSISDTRPENSPLWNSLEALNTKRGPDAQQTHVITIQDQQAQLYLRFFSSVLHLRGDHVVPQPMTPATGDVLSWNGEIFGGLEITLGENDTEVLVRRLAGISPTDTSEKAVLDILTQIEGPFAFVFWQAHTNRLWFGRDCLGRRSLLWARSKSLTNKSFMLSSVGPSSASSDSGSDNVVWEEVPADGLYCIQMEDIETETTDESVFGHPIRHFSWVQQENSGPNTLPLPFPLINRYVPKDLSVDTREGEPVVDGEMETAIEEFTLVLSESVRRRVADVPSLGPIEACARVAILFSGGLDCITLAALAHQHLPHCEPIDLLNVAFENPRREQALQKPKKSKNKKKHNDVEVTEESSTALDQQPVIQTINIYDTPDRVTGRAGVAELRKIAPERIWNFVEINVPYPEAMSHKQRIIELMYPLDTVMDLSIAMAFWFASRGEGTIDDNGNTKPYHSRSRVLLSGLGADEQLGGYSRHKDAFRRGGWDKVIEETQMDVDRISTRRDDRIMSDHGKEVRFPFLSTDVVNWLCRCPIYIKMDLRYERGIGEKLLLRNVARRLGLSEASKNWKRAIQFGAKTAKMTDSSRSEKGQHKLS